MTNSHQQAIVDAGFESRHPMLEKGSYVLWSSKFMKYIDGKKDYGKMLKDSEEKYLTGNDKKRFEGDIDAMNTILLGIQNDIYNSVDACKTAKAMWTRVRRLMQGTNLSKQ
ncbi:hypothetical protein Tco_0884697 [Tanacetum coccineum]